MSQPAKKSAIEYRDQALRRRKRWATVSVVFTLALVCFSYYFYQVFFTANIETKGKPTYVVVHRGDNWQAALKTIDGTGVVVATNSISGISRRRASASSGTVPVWVSMPAAVRRFSITW